MAESASSHSENIEALCAIFEAGCKARQTGQVGIELEHFIVQEDGTAVTYAQENGVRFLLETLSSGFEEKLFSEDGALIGLARPGESITLEPAAQLEWSAGPFSSLDDAQAQLNAFEESLQNILAPLGLHACTQGYHPSARASELPLIPKGRYRLMDAAFAQIGPFGRCMMRGSASTQISIDYLSEADCCRKLRLANAAAPLLALASENSPIFEGKPTAEHLPRTRIWLNCDPARCATIPGVLAADYSWERYAQWVLSTPAIVRCNDEKQRLPEKRSFAELYQQQRMTHDELMHALSLVFPDARLKNYVELRAADALPPQLAISYAALVKGLFTTNAGMDALDELLGNATENDVMQAKLSSMQSGLSGKAFGRTAVECLSALFSAAQCGLPSHETALLTPLRTRLERSDGSAL